MKKIWFLNHYAIPPNMGGGTRHYDLSEELIKRDYDVTVVASSFEIKTRKEKLEINEKYRIEVLNGVKFIWIKTYPYKTNNYKRFFNMISFALNSYKVCRKMEKPDVIIASSVHPFTCISGYFLAKKKKARYIAEIRDLWPQTLIDMGALKERSIVTKVFRYIEKFIYKRAEKIIILLPKIADYIKSYGISDEKLVYIPNGVVIKRYDEIISLNKNSLTVSKIMKDHIGKFTAIYLGAHGPANNLENIIKSAKIIQSNGCDDIHFLMVGDGVTKSKLVDMVKEQGITNVFFYQPIAKYDVPLLLKEIDVCLFNLAKVDVFKYGISPNKLFDYLSSKKPIVFACETTNDIVNEAQAGISIKPENEVLFAETVLKIYKMNENERKTLGINGRRYVEEFHDISVLVSKLEEIL
jgi:glycosyltransferase involved in cell wall biosynthesis